MKKKVVKTKLKQKQVQSQKQVVNINIGDKGTKSKAKRRASSRPAKPSFLPVGPTIVMNPNIPQQPMQPMQPMQRQQQTNLLNPPRPPPPIGIPINYRQPIPEYTSVDYLDDSERSIELNPQRLRAERLRRFLAEPLSRSSETESISDLSSLTEYTLPPTISNVSGFSTVYNGPDYISSEYTPFTSFSGTPDSSLFSDIIIPELFSIPPPQAPIGSVASSSTSINTPDSVSLSSLSEQTAKKSAKKSSEVSPAYAEVSPEFTDIYPNIEGTGGVAFVNPQRNTSASSVFNSQEPNVIQLSEMDLINQASSAPAGGAFGGGGPIRNDRTAVGRKVREEQQLAQKTGSDVPLELLLKKRYGFSASGVRRPTPTVEQRQRLFNVGQPYRGDENGVVKGSKKK
jgi:hypothetical protein